MLSKSVVSVFRGLSSLEKSVDYCSIEIDSSRYKMTFVFHCKYGIIKTHQLGFEDCEALRAVYNKDSAPNMMSQCSRPLQEALGSLPSGISEVSLSADADQLLLSNYVEEQEDNSRVPMSKVLLYPDEFEDYQTEGDTSITFCLKELKAILTFTSALSDSLSVRFETTGRPVIFSIEGNPLYTADFVLATLSDPDTEFPQTQSQRTQMSSSTTKINNTTEFTETSSTSQSTVRNERDLSTCKSRNTTSHKRKASISSVDQTGVSNSTEYGSEHFPSLVPSTNATQDPTLLTDHWSSVKTAGIVTDSQTDRSGTERGWVRRRTKNVSVLGNDDDDFDYSLHRKGQFVSQTDSHAHGVLESQDHTTQESIMDDSGFLPSTPPPTKKFKSIFSSSDMFGGFPQGSASILAPDSEDEDTL